MANEKKDEPTQKTPQGAEIPVPKRDEFFANMEKVAKPKTPWWKRLRLRRSED